MAHRLVDERRLMAPSVANGVGPAAFPGRGRPVPLRYSIRTTCGHCGGGPGRHISGVLCVNSV